MPQPVLENFNMAHYNAHDAALQWDKEFSKRQRIKYAAEDTLRLDIVPGDKRKFFEALFEWGKSRHLDPPEEFSFSALRQFLEDGDVSVLDLKKGTKGLDDRILLDDRQDDQGEESSVRDWDSDLPGHRGYFRYPPRGTVAISRAIDLGELVRILSGKRIESGRERRTMYGVRSFVNGHRVNVLSFVPDISPHCAMPFLATAPKRSIPALRSYIQRYVQFRSSFHVSRDPPFVLQFHIPYFALRRGKKCLDKRNIRQARPLPLARTKTEQTDYYYEAQVSLLIIGVDEWLWTAYCLIDTYHGSEPDKLTYLDDKYPSEPATGGSSGLDFPLWNPREFFLVVLRRRIMQAVREMKALVDAFEGRMNTYESKSLFEFVDDENFTKTQELTLTASILRSWRDSIAKTIKAWEEFQKEGIKSFELVGLGALRLRWESHLSSIHNDIAELQSYELLLNQKLDLFVSMRNAMGNASALKEAAAATKQGELIKLLTMMTVVCLIMSWICDEYLTDRKVYLPLTLTVGIFGMNIVLGTAHRGWIVIVLICSIALTGLATVHARVIDQLKSMML